jgi:RNA polymerase sigma-70 factor, ECF subfamily
VSGNRAAAEDAVQEALARAWERSERGQRIAAPSAWVTTVAMNLIRSRFRRILAERRAHERLRDRSGQDRGSYPDSGRSPSAVGDAIDVRRALTALPRRQRETTVLRYYLGMEVAEIAAVLGISEGTAKTTLHRARRALARSLGESDVNEETTDVVRL